LTFVRYPEDEAGDRGSRLRPCGATSGRQDSENRRQKAGVITFGVTAMKRKREKTSTAEFEKAAARQDPATYVLRLYVTGMTPKSTQAIANIRELCKKHLAGRYELEVIDIYQQPELSREEQIIASPTLIKKLPLPLRRLIGDMSDTDRFLVGIDLKSRNS
jgi:circadian clock protein KaiB